MRILSTYEWCLYKLLKFFRDLKGYYKKVRCLTGLIQHQQDGVSKHIFRIKLLFLFIEGVPRKREGV